jgi:hypothetical protein
MASASSRDTNLPSRTFGSTGARVTGPAEAVKTRWKFLGYGYGWPSGRGPSLRSSMNPSGRGSPMIQEPTSSPISRANVSRTGSALSCARRAGHGAVLVEHENRSAEHGACRDDELERRLLISQKTREEERSHPQTT